MNDLSIQTLFQTPLFLQLLDTHINTLLQPKTSQSLSLQPQSLESLQTCDLLTELSEQINSIVSFNLKLVLADEFTNILQDSAQLQKDVEELREKVMGISVKMSAEEGRVRCNPNTADDFQEFEESMEEGEKVVAEEDGQIVKLRNQLQAIKNSLIRFAGLGSDIKDPRTKIEWQTFETRLTRLGREIQNMNSAASPSILEQNSTIDRFSVVEHQLQALRELAEGKAKQEAALNDKYQTSFRSVWNVVTMMESSIAEVRKSVQEKLERADSNKSEKKGFMDKMFK